MVLGLTDRELELLALSHRCMETKPDVSTYISCFLKR